MNPFEIFNIRKSYDIDKVFLEKKYLETQMIYHPDKASNDSEKEHFLTLSMNINNSYKILKNDYDRSILLLNLAKIDQDSIKISNEFFEAILSKNEELNNINDSTHINDFITVLNNEYKAIYSIILDAFGSENYNIASIKTIEMKYISNLITKAKEKLRCCN